MAESEAAAPAIGIDLGTTNSCVSVWENGRVVVIPNSESQYTTPSYVTFEGSNCIVGIEAKKKVLSAPLQTIYDIKRIIGRRYNDPNVQQDIQLLSYNVVEDKEMPRVEVQFNGERKLYAPEEISSFVLTKMKESAEEYLGKTVKDAVITVPAHFNDLQRKATIDAAQIAGLNVLLLISEPTAAANAYGYHNGITTKRNMLVFDLGGGNFDVSILTIHQKACKVIATGGDTHLGGEDFDKRMFDYVLNKIKTQDERLQLNASALQRLRMACEEAKRELSKKNEASIDIVSFYPDGKNFNTKIDQATFNDLNEDLFEKTIQTVRKTLDDAKLKKGQIDGILLVGGSSKIPKIRALLVDFFDGKSLTTNINADEAIACGAAIHAAVLQCKLSGFDLLDATPLSLGIELHDGTMSFLIERNTIFPICHAKRFTTVIDNQIKIAFQIYQGESKLTKENFRLGELCLDGIEPAEKGKEKVNVSFNIDINGILKVIASYRKENGEILQKECIVNRSGRLSKDEIKRMVDEATQRRLQDILKKEAIAAKIELKTFCLKVVKKNSNLTGMDLLRDRCNQTLEWLEAPEKTTGDYVQCLQMLKASYEAINIASTAGKPGNSQDVDVCAETSVSVQHN